jgi:ppGpp synthetase/RelA/SpoT-type nucleotidyltranferase
MPLTETIVRSAVERYRREYDRYLKLARRVDEICRAEVVEANAIRAQVTFRAKDPKRLEGKLMKFLHDPSWSARIGSVEELLDNVSDLAAVRVATYEEKDRARVAEVIGRVFVGRGGGAVDIEVKDAEGRFYRATHCGVCLPARELAGAYENLAGLNCEIQVSSMLAHVWNEIEHDLRYKPQSGEPTERENELLTALAQLLSAGDIVIKHLLEEAEKRSREGVPLFVDVSDDVSEGLPRKAA